MHFLVQLVRLFNTGFEKNVPFLLVQNSETLMLCGEGWGGGEGVSWYENHSSARIRRLRSFTKMVSKWYTGDHFKQYPGFTGDMFSTLPCGRIN